MVRQASIAAIALVCVLAGCRSQSTAPGGPVSTSSLPSCGELPSSTGPAADLATLVVAAPAAGKSGQDVPVTAKVEVSKDGQRVITVPNGSELLITQAGLVVGKTNDAGRGGQIPLLLKAGTTPPGQALPESVRLSGCPSGAAGARSPLPPGSYGLVGVLGYRVDSFNSAFEGTQAAGLFQLVSEPVPIRVE